METGEAGAEETAILIFLDVMPQELVAMMVYVADALMAVGVPVICPEILFKNNPAGNAGEME